MGTGRLGHFAQTNVQPLCKQNVQQTNPVLAGRAGTQMRECIREACGFGHVLEDVCNPGMGQAPIKIEHKIAGFIGNIRFQTFDPQFAIFDDTVGKGTISDR